MTTTDRTPDLLDGSQLCQRCEQKPVAVRQETRHPGDPAHWPNDVTLRCEACAQALRQYVALPSISLTIVSEQATA